jgi:hypothetical protein
MDYGFGINGIRIDNPRLGVACGANGEVIEQLDHLAFIHELSHLLRTVQGLSEDLLPARGSQNYGNNREEENAVVDENYARRDEQRPLRVGHGGEAGQLDGSAIAAEVAAACAQEARLGRRR